jgi:hypothetical protein
MMKPILDTSNKNVAFKGIYHLKKIVRSIFNVKRNLTMRFLAKFFLAHIYVAGAIILQRLPPYHAIIRLARNHVYLYLIFLALGSYCYKFHKPFIYTSMFMSFTILATILTRNQETKIIWLFSFKEKHFVCSQMYTLLFLPQLLNVCDVVIFSYQLCPLKRADSCTL